MKTPTIHQLHDNLWAVAVETPSFDMEYVDDLKRLIPSRQRKWVPDEKRWWFKAAVVDDVLTILRYHFGAYQWAEPAQGTAIMNLDNAFKLLHLTQDAPLDLVRVAYRWHAKRCHPDVGGDTAAMQTINEAVKLIEGARSDGQD